MNKKILNDIYILVGMEELKNGNELFFETRKNNFYLKMIGNNNFEIIDDKNYYQNYFKSESLNELILELKQFFEGFKIKEISII